MTHRLVVALAVAVLPLAAHAATRSCTSGDLQIATGRAGAWRGFATQEIRLTNQSSAACALSGAPGVSLQPSNEEVTAHPDVAAALAGTTELAPGDTAVVLLGAPGSCEAAAGPERKVTTRLQVRAPGGGAKTIEGAHVDTLCGAAKVLHLHVDPAPAAPKPLEQLTSTLAVQGRPMPGSTLQYTVTLTNPTSAEVSFAPCPSFTHSLWAGAVLASSSQKLDCAAVGGRIAPGARVSFDLTLAIPAHVDSDAAKLSWKLDDGPAAGAAVPLREIAR